MRARDLGYETLTALLANRARSLLTILGIVIGIAAVIAMTALIDGMRQQLVGQLGLNAARMVNIVCWPPGNQPLDEGDIEEMASDLSADYEFVTSYSYANPASVASPTAELEYPSVIACEPEYFTAMGLEASQGRLFTSEEAEDGAMVVVLGGSAVNDLFGTPDAEVAGQSLRIGSDSYTVAGAVPNAANYQNYPIIYMPAETATTRIIGQQGSVSQNIVGFAHEGLDMYAVAAETDAYLRARFNIPEEDPDSGGDSMTGYVYVSTAQEYIDQLDSTMATFRLLALAVAGVSLLVGGIGIMNMMLTNVTERIREIGLRKALGARRADVTRQFLLESVTICLVGGAFGILAGYGGAWALAGVAGPMLGSTGGELVPVISPGAVALACGVSVGIGVVFGWYPARRASRMDPVEALRYQ